MALSSPIKKVAPAQVDMRTASHSHRYECQPYVGSALNDKQKGLEVDISNQIMQAEAQPKAMLPLPNRVLYCLTDLSLNYLPRNARIKGNVSSGLSQIIS